VRTGTLIKMYRIVYINSCIGISIIVFDGKSEILVRLFSSCNTTRIASQLAGRCLIIIGNVISTVSVLLLICSLQIIGNSKTKCHETK